MKSFKGPFLVVYWNLLILIAGLLVVELSFGSWFLAPQLWSLSIYRNTDWRLNVSDKYAHEGPTRYIRDYYGLRGTFGTPAHAELMTLGGSTTDERFIDEAATWPEVMGRCLRARGYEADVANAGITGQSTRGNIMNFDIWLNHIDGLRPNLVVVYVGINELYAGAPDQIKMDDVRTFTEAITAHDPWKSFRKWARMSSALYGLSRIVKGNIRAWKTGVTIRPGQYHGSEWPAGKPRMVDVTDARYLKVSKINMVLDSPEHARRLTKVTNQNSKRLAELRGRLGVLTKKIQAFGAVPVYATNPWGLFRIQDNIVSGNLSLYFTQHAYLEVVRAHCLDEGLTCVDVARKLKVENGDFFDGAHTTEKGSKKVGQLICDELLQTRDLPLSKQN